MCLRFARHSKIQNPFEPTHIVLCGYNSDCFLTNNSIIINQQILIIFRNGKYIWLPATCTHTYIIIIYQFYIPTIVLNMRDTSLAIRINNEYFIFYLTDETAENVHYTAANFNKFMSKHQVSE